MLKLLVVLDHSPELTISLKVACHFETDVIIQPIYVSPPPKPDLAIGAGWARNSWTKEKIRQALTDVRGQVYKKQNQYPNIKSPIVATGDPINIIAKQFVSKNYDMIIIGVPFNSLGPIAIARRFSDIIRKSEKELPLLIVRHFTTLSKSLVLTDGGDAAEAVLGFLNMINPLIFHNFSLIGLANKNKTISATEKLTLERGLAILKEKDIDAEGYTAKNLGSDGIRNEFSKADLLISPFSSDICTSMYELFGKEIAAILFYLDNLGKGR